MILNYIEQTFEESLREFVFYSFMNALYNSIIL